MMRDQEDAWTLFTSPAQLMRSWDRKMHRLIVLYTASAPGQPEPAPCLVDVNDSGVITLIKRIRDDSGA